MGFMKNFYILKIRFSEHGSHKAAADSSTEHGKCDLIVIYEVKEPEPLSLNGHYLSIDLGIHNLMTCYDSENGRSFILGKKISFAGKILSQRNQQGSINMVCTAGGKWHKISPIIETYQEAFIGKNRTQ